MSGGRLRFFWNYGIQLVIALLLPSLVVWIPSTGGLFLVSALMSYGGSGTSLFPQYFMHPYFLAIHVPVLVSVWVLHTVSRDARRDSLIASWAPYVVVVLSLLPWWLFCVLLIGAPYAVYPLPIPTMLPFQLRWYSAITKDIEQRPMSTRPTFQEVGEYESKPSVATGRGGEFVGNRFRYKVKVQNNGSSVITDVAVSIVSYPRDSLILKSDLTCSIPKIEPRGFRSPAFDFLPTQDCVKGEVVASVTYVDSAGKGHSSVTEPYVIRSVCDLLHPESISPKDFMLKLGTLGSGEMTCRVEDWTPEEMHEKTNRILRDSNFFEVESSINTVGTHIESVTKGWAKGIYTGRKLGVTVVITGKPGARGANCKVMMSGEDEAMIMPAIDEMSQKLGAWLCPRCGASLPPELVDRLKDGASVTCPFCAVTMDR